MTTRHYLAQLLRYSSWANQTLFRAIPHEVLDVPIKSSFPTIRRTALHIWDAEWVWFERVNGRSPGDLDLEFYDGPFEEAVRLMSEQSSQWIAAIDSRSDDELSASIEYRNIKGEPFTRCFDEIVMHVCNHSTFHRGQIVTMLRENGVTDIPGTDMTLFFASQK
jgi:uncharacterized damage-inducible protein DinB